jgi:hypothetical protein
MTFLALLGILLVTPLRAQDTGTVWGTVKDSSGAVTPGAQVRITNLRTGQVQTATSRGDGTYYLTSLPVGLYKLESEIAGFKKYSRPELTVNVNENVRVDISLNAGDINETVTVTSEAALVETSSANEGTLISSERIRQLPLNGRNALQLQLLAPGVTAHNAEGGGENRGVSINGSRGTMNN